MVITMAKLRMAHASTHGARKPPGPIFMASIRSQPPGPPAVPGVFSPSFVFDPLRGNSRVWKFVSPNILAYMQNNNCNFYFFTKKLIFRHFSSFNGHRSVTAAWATRSPWSITMKNPTRKICQRFSQFLLNQNSSLSGTTSFIQDNLTPAYPYAHPYSPQKGCETVPGNLVKFIPCHSVFCYIASK